MNDFLRLDVLVFLKARIKIRKRKDIDLMDIEPIFKNVCCVYC